MAWFKSKVNKHTHTHAYISKIKTSTNLFIFYRYDIKSNVIKKYFFAVFNSYQNENKIMLHVHVRRHFLLFSYSINSIQYIYSNKQF